jgi:nicotinamide mononucleotide transporter
MQIVHALQQWWLQQTWQELVGVTTGLLCVYLAAVNNIWNWPVAIISTGLYIYIFGKTSLYADMLLNIYFFVTSIYGWYQWAHHPPTEDKSPVVRITGKQILISVIAIAVTTPALGYTMIRFTATLHYNPPAFPYIDSFLTACSFVAQILLAKKIMENWLLWIFADVIYTVIYFKKDLVDTSIMYGILIIIALFGYIDWLKIYKKQQLPVSG